MGRNKRPFTEEEDAYIRANFTALTQKQLGEKLGLPQYIISRRLKDLGLAYPKELKTERYKRPNQDLTLTPKHIAQNLAKSGFPPTVDEETRDSYLRAFQNDPKLLELAQQVVKMKKVISQAKKAKKVKKSKNKLSEGEK